MKNVKKKALTVGIFRKQWSNRFEAYNELGVSEFVECSKKSGSISSHILRIGYSYQMKRKLIAFRPRTEARPMLGDFKLTLRLDHEMAIVSRFEPQDHFRSMTHSMKRILLLIDNGNFFIDIHGESINNLAQE